MGLALLLVPWVTRPRRRGRPNGRASSSSVAPLKMIARRKSEHLRSLPDELGSPPWKAKSAAVTYAPAWVGRRATARDGRQNADGREGRGEGSTRRGRARGDVEGRAGGCQHITCACSPWLRVRRPCTSTSFLAAGFRHPAGACMLQRAKLSLREGPLGTQAQLATSCKREAGLYCGGGPAHPLRCDGTG